MVLTGMTSLFYLRVGVGAFATARGHLVSPDLVGLSRAVEPPPELGHRRVGGQHARHCHVPATRHAVLRLARIHAHRAVCLLEMKERDKKKHFSQFEKYTPLSNVLITARSQLG